MKHDVRYRGLHDSKGFTLLELILAVAIIAILSAVGIPILFGLVGQTEATVCEANRATLSRGYAYAKSIGSTLSLEEYIAVSAQKQEAVCPSDGTFSVAESGSSILCSLHGGSNGSETHEYTNSNTQFYLEDVDGKTLKFSSLGDMESINSRFFAENPKGTQTFTAGEIFYYQGSYYVWKRSLSVYASSNLDQVIGWYAAKIDMNNEIGYLNVSTGTIIKGDKVTKGSMYYVDFEGNGTYVLAYNRGESDWATGTVLNTWYMGPKAAGYWIVLDDTQGEKAS